MFNDIPWVEKYRPNTFNKIVLNNNNKIIFKNIIEKNLFPNLLLYGPPGTGKTTTIVNLIQLYQEKYEKKNNTLIQHLNASDERGIDIIRNQIYNFVNTKPLFINGVKFVILDEVDYMTKNAQQALKYLIQDYNSDVRFCLICNYISKIDETLQNEFIKVRFNNLPSDEISIFLKSIINNQKLNINDNILSNIQQYYESDIRSMINYIQLNQDNLQKNNNSINIINNDIWIDIIEIIKNNDNIFIEVYINKISLKYNIEHKNIIQQIVNFLIIERKKINNEILDIIETIIHESFNRDTLKYFIIVIKKFIKNL
jgi:replication factor C subunit 3/5